MGKDTFIEAVDAFEEAVDAFEEANHPLVFSLALSRKRLRGGNEYEPLVWEEAIRDARLLSGEVHSLMREVDDRYIVANLSSFSPERCVENEGGFSPHLAVVLVGEESDIDCIARAYTGVGPNVLGQGREYTAVAQFDWGFTDGGIDKTDFQNVPEFRKVLEQICNQFVLRARLPSKYSVGFCKDYAHLSEREGQRIEADDKAWEIAASGLVLPKVYQ